MISANKIQAITSLFLSEFGVDEQVFKQKLEKATFPEADKFKEVFCKNIVEPTTMKKFNIAEFVISELNKPEFNDYVNIFFMECFTLKKKTNPSDPLYRFSFGVPVEFALINLFTKVFGNCESTGASAFYDIRLKIGEEYYDISVKAKSTSKNSPTILVNQFDSSNVKDFTAMNLNTIVIKIEDRKIYFISHTEEIDKHTSGNGTSGASKIAYKASIFKFLDENRPECVYKLKENQRFNDFMANEYNNIQPIDIHKEFYEKYIKIA